MPSLLFERALFRALLPFVLPQGLWVKATARRSLPASGERVGAVGDGAPFRLVLVGDSIVAGIGVERLDDAMPGQLARALADALGKRVTWTASGVSGYKACEVRGSLVPDLPAAGAECVFVSVGVNDATGLRTTAQWRRDLVALLTDLRARYSSALIVVSGLPPMHGFPALPQPLRAVFGLRARTFDRIAEDATRGLERVLFVPNRFDPRPEFFAPDGYHPSADSCRAWAVTVGAAVVGRLARPIHEDSSRRAREVREYEARDGSATKA
ncbi:MAG: SGNH/GDSL hydrolase family protein [Thermoanaerobaculia bacterium]